MRERVPIFEIVLVLIGVAVLTVTGVLREQRAITYTNTYSSYDARPGGYRAWYELLRREEVRVDRYERYWVFLDSSTTTLIVAMPSNFSEAIVPGKNGVAALESWVRNGGTLVLLGSVPSFGLDTVLTELSYRRLSREYFTSIGVTGALEIQEASFGRGKVFRVADQSLFRNEHIAFQNVARLAYALGASRDGGVTAFDETMHGYLLPEHWWQVAPRRFVQALLGACVVLFLALLGATLRLGPAIALDERHEADSSTYLDAVAGLHARAKAGRKVLEDITDMVKRDVAKASVVSEETHAAIDELERLTRVAHPNERTFVRAAASAHDIQARIRQGA